MCLIGKRRLTIKDKQRHVVMLVGSGCVCNHPALSFTLGDFPALEILVLMFRSRTITVTRTLEDTRLETSMSKNIFPHRRIVSTLVTYNFHLGCHICDIYPVNHKSCILRALEDLSSVALRLKGTVPEHSGCRRCSCVPVE